MVGLSLLPLACQRPLLSDELIGGSGTSDDGAETNTDGTGKTDSDGADSSDGGEEGSSDDAEPSCHPSYEPCLPVVDDLNCPDVVALGVAPVSVVGPDEYGLDADGDGIGCEP